MVVEGNRNVYQRAFVAVHQTHRTYQLVCTSMSSKSLFHTVTVRALSVLAS